MAKEVPRFNRVLFGKKTKTHRSHGLSKALDEIISQESSVRHETRYSISEKDYEISMPFRSDSSLCKT